MNRSILSIIVTITLSFSLFATGCVAKQKIDGIPDKTEDSNGPIRYFEPINEELIITNGTDINVCGASIGDAAIDVFEHMIQACAGGAPLFVSLLDKDWKPVKKLKDADLIILEGGPSFTLSKGRITEIKIPDNYAMEDAVLEEYPSRPFKEGLSTMMLKLFGGTPELVTDNVVRIKNGNVTIEASKEHSYNPILR